MKLVKAYIRPVLLEDVYKNLRSNGHCCISVFKGEGVGKFSDPQTEHGSLDFPAMHSHIVKIEIVARESSIDSIIKIIRDAASTGSSGDGNIFVTNIEQAVRIRDGEEGAKILQ